MKIKSLINLKILFEKAIFLRVDFNVPLKNGRIVEDHKIRAGLETINFLLKNKCRIIIATHLGDPGGRMITEYSTKPVASRLKKLLGRPVKFISQVSGPQVDRAIKKMKPGEIIFLENLRFESGELNNDSKFAQELASLADIYVNDALAVSHRQQASVSAIKDYLPAYAGLLLQKELLAFQKTLKPRKPLVIILGGAKISTKAPLISKFYGIASQIILGGALANNFFKFQKLEIGQSLYDQNSAKDIRQFFSRNKLKPKIILPVDIIVKTRSGQAVVRQPKEIKKTDCILDIGPESISHFSSLIKKAQTIVWNGPMGKFEEASFKYGTLAVARLVASRSTGPAYGLVGGGETVAALELSQMAEYVDWISTAGGAMLTYLGGGFMPGLTKIVTK